MVADGLSPASLIEALRRSEQNFRTIIEEAPVAMCVSSADRVLYANRALLQYLGYGHEGDMSGPTLAELSDELIHPDDRQRLRGAFARLFEDLKTADGGASAHVVRIDDVRLFAKSDRSIRYCDVHGVVVMHDGAPAVVTTLHDQTARHTTADRMRLADRMSSLGTLAAGVAHEINNPLMYVIGNVEFATELLARGSEPGDRAVSALRQARVGLDRIRKTVRALKAFSRADEETVEAVDVIQVLESCILMVGGHLRHRGRLSREYSTAPPVRGNESRIAQVLLNLLVNAAEALEEQNEPRNEVVVRVSAADDQVLVEVRDNGRGIAAADMKRIFDPFFTTKPVGVGTGLGLFVCHEIVKAIGGDIRVESRLGAGTSAFVRLPAAAGEKPRNQDVRKRAPSRRARILLIDDEPEVLASLRRVLEMEHEVVTLSNGRDALELLSTGARFDLILCDLMMPGLTGADTYARMEQDFPDAANRVVFMTGGAVTAAMERFLERAPRACLEKPFDAVELHAFIRAQVD